MEWQLDSINRIPEIGRISYWITKKLGRSNEVNEISTKCYKEAI